MPGSAVPCFVGELRAVFEIGEEDVAHSPVEVGIEHDQVALEIVFQATEVEVGRSGSDHIVVYNHGLGMNHTVFVEIYLDSGLKAFGHVGEAGELQEPAIAPARYHHPDINL